MLPTALLVEKRRKPVRGLHFSKASNMWHEPDGIRDVVAEAERKQAAAAA